MTEADRQEALEANRWMAFAHEDLGAARALLERKDLPPRLACFHAQQAAEKALKALLVVANISFPKTHDLIALKKLMPEDRDLGAGDDVLGRLSSWAIDVRYPGDAPEANQSDAQQAINEAMAVLEAAVLVSKARKIGGAQ